MSVYELHGSSFTIHSAESKPDLTPWHLRTPGPRSVSTPLTPLRRMERQRNHVLTRVERRSKEREHHALLSINSGCVGGGGVRIGHRFPLAQETVWVMEGNSPKSNSMASNTSLALCLLSLPAGRPFPHGSLVSAWIFGTRALFGFQSGTRVLKSKNLSSLFSFCCRRFPFRLHRRFDPYLLC